MENSMILHNYSVRVDRSLKLQLSDIKIRINKDVIPELSVSVT